MFGRNESGERGFGNVEGGEGKERRSGGAVEVLDREEGSGGAEDQG